MNTTDYDLATVQLQFHAAEMVICELALCGDPTKPHQAAFQRTRFLYACVQSARQWFEAFFSIPVPEMNGIATATLMQMRHAAGLLSAISLVDEPGWKKAEVAEIIDLYPTLDRLASFISQIPAATSTQHFSDAEKHDDHWWTHVASTIRTLRSIWAGEDEHGNSSAPPLASFNDGEVDASIGAMEFDFPGLDWLLDPSMMASSF